MDPKWITEQIDMAILFETIYLNNLYFSVWDEDISPFCSCSKTWVTKDAFWFSELFQSYNSMTFRIHHVKYTGGCLPIFPTE